MRLTERSARAKAHVPLGPLVRSSDESSARSGGRAAAVGCAGLLVLEPSLCGRLRARPFVADRLRRCRAPAGVAARLGSFPLHNVADKHSRMRQLSCTNRRYRSGPIRSQQRLQPTASRWQRSLDCRGATLSGHALIIATALLAEPNVTLHSKGLLCCSASVGKLRATDGSTRLWCTHSDSAGQHSKGPTFREPSRPPGPSRRLSAPCRSCATWTGRDSGRVPSKQLSTASPAGKQTECYHVLSLTG